MCSVCGCGQPDGRVHPHHDHHHHHQSDGGGAGLDFCASPAGATDQARLVAIERDVLGANDRLAAGNRAWFAEHGVFVLNLVSSPGAGKTTLLCRTVHDLGTRFPVAVIEGDQQTSNDAARIRATGAKAVQINTGKGCHLDGHMIAHAIERLDPARESVLFIENVGNLVCPAAFDLGEHHKVVILSVTEGEDKPLKYPDMFAAADLMVLNKIDLLPYVGFDAEAAVAYARQVNHRIDVVRTSATTGEGLDDWYAWIATRRAAAHKTAASGGGRIAEQ